MTKLLTNKKTAWAKQFQPKLVTGKRIPVNAGVQEWYAGKLEKLALDMTQKTERAIARLFRAEGQTGGFSQDASLSSQARILLNRLRGEIGSAFEKKAVALAADMIRRSSKENASAVHESLKALSGGLSIKTDFISGKLKESLKAAVAENVSYIRSIKEDYHTKVQGAVMRSITTGSGLADLVPELEKIGKLTRTRAHFIALDQTKKANEALTRQRLLDAGVTHFRWIHTGRSKTPRKHHLNVLNRRVFRFDDPPIIDPARGQRGFPGDLPNCKCDLEPVIMFDESEVGTVV